MSVLLSRVTGNFLTAATWGLVDATSYSNSESSSVNATTSYQQSTAFTPGAITIDGIAVKLASRIASPSGTVSVSLAQAGVTVAGTEVIINCSDLPLATAATTDGGWIVFGFASKLLTAATAYTVQIKASVGSSCAWWVSATTNWARALRTTTTQAPVAGDDMIVAGEHTGAGTGNSFVVTMDQTVNTNYGSNTTSAVTPAISICKRGTLKFKDTSAANPYLRVSGHIVVYNGGEFDVGTVATPIPRNSTAILEFNCAADGDFGLITRNGSIGTLQGLSRTLGKNVVSARLVADSAVNLMQAIALAISGITNSAATTVLDPTGTSLAVGGAAGTFNQLVAISDTVANSNHKATWTGVVSVTGVTQVYTQWVKRGSGTNNRFVRLQLATATALPATNGFFADFDLQAGTVGTVTALGNGTATSASITAFGGGFICTIIGKISSGAAAPIACIGACNASTVVSYAGDATQNFIINWPQVYTASAQPTADTIDTDTGWLSGDVVALASTTRTANECEVASLNGNAGASTLTYNLYPVNARSGTGNVSNTVTLTIASPCVVSGNKDAVNGAAVSFATTGTLPTGLVAATVYYVINKATDGTHQLAATPGGVAINTTGSQSGVQTATVSCTQAEVILLTRNVKVRAVSITGTGMTFVNPVEGSTFAADWVEFYGIGANVLGKKGIEIGNSAGASFNINASITHCSIHDTKNEGFHVTTQTTNVLTTFVFSNNTMWNLGTTLGPGCNFASTMNSTNYTIDNNILIRTGNGNGWTLADVGGTFTNNTVVGAAATGINLSEGSAIGTMSGNVAHSNATLGFSFTTLGMSGTFAIATAWRNTSFGYSITVTMADFIIDTPIAFGNTTNDFNIAASCDVYFKTPVSNGDTTFSTASGISVGVAGGAFRILLDNGDFSTVSGIKAAHTQDINLASATEALQIVTRNTKLGAATQVATSTNLSNNGYVACEKLGQIAGAHKTFMRNGSVATDTVVYNTASPSMVMTPQAQGTFTGATTATSPTITVAAASLGILATLAVGDLIIGTAAAFPVGTTVSAISASAGTITASANAGATQAADTISYCKKLQSAPLFESIKAAAASETSLTPSVYIIKRAENLFTFSQDYSQAAWTVTNSTPATGQTDGVGGSTATQFLETITNSALHGVARGASVTFVSGATYTVAFDAKGVNRQWVRFTENGRNTWLDLTNGIVGTHDAAHTVAFTSLGSGWYRVSITIVASNTIFAPTLVSATADNGSASFVGNVSNGFLTDRWQVENGTVASPYQVTTAANQPGYNGQQPRLGVRANPAVGILADTVLQTYSGGNGAWAQISGATVNVTDDGVLEFFIDCDGNTGAINVDDWSMA